MFTPQQKKKLSNLTKDLISSANDLPAEKSRAKQLAENLRSVIRYHDWLYYVLASNDISDEEYDQLFKHLVRIEEKYEDLVSPDSPTQRIPADLTKDFPEVEHLTPMLSLDNSYDASDLENWDRKVKELSGNDDVAYCVEPKFDGASITLIYKDDILIRAATRGDGTVGEEITPNVKVLRSVPLSASFSERSVRHIELRGEVLIKKSVFLKINELRMDEGLKVLANPRNSAAGALRLQDAREVAGRGLEAFIYQVSYAVDKGNNDLMEKVLNKHDQNISFLHQLGFRAPNDEIKVCTTIDEVFAYCQEWEATREDYPFEIDGMVIKVNQLSVQKKLGSTSHHPRWAMAYKFKSKQAQTKLLKVEFQVGRTGTITPVAKLEPVSLAGVTVSSVSMFNEDFVKEKDIRIGDNVLVERAGDVIPYIVKPLIDKRTGNETRIKFPKKCPSCSEALVKPEDESAWRCININCKAQAMERMIHYVSKNAMNIDGLGRSLVKKFFDMELMSDIAGIYKLDFERIGQLEGFGEKSVENLKAAIEDSKQRPIHRLLFGLGIRFVGDTTAKTMAREITCIENLKQWDEDQLMQMEDIGPKVASSVARFFNNDSNLRMLDEIKALGVNTCQDKTLKKRDLKFDGNTFLFTGTLEKYSRDEAKEIIEELGGKVVNSVSSRLNYLVVGLSPGSKLIKAQKIETITILNERDFFQLVK